MADWYVSSASYAAVPAWAATTAYTVGQFVRPTAASVTTRYVFRVTTAGTSGASEPTWPGANNGTVTNGGAGFTNVAGQSTYGWSAAVGTLASIVAATSNRPVAGDRVLLASDHTETTSTMYGFDVAGFGTVQVISVNRAGSVPPVAADITPGAAIVCSSNTLFFDPLTEIFWQGISFTGLGGSVIGHISFNGGNGVKVLNFKNCAFSLPSTNVGSRINAASSSNVVFDNTTVQFGNASQGITTGASGSLNLTWLNTPSAVQGATVPTTLFFSGTPSSGIIATCRGVDLSALTGNILSGLVAIVGWVKVLLDGCKIAPAVARLGSTFSNAGDEIELVNCYDGTNTLNERYTAAGAVTTDRSATLSGGAVDDIGAYSLKLASSSRADKSVLTLDSFWLDVENTAIGAAKTATVEVISSSSLNDNDISLLLEYMGTSGSSVASFASSLPSVLATGSALTTSSATWNSPPATPVKQKLQVTFTPQRAGRVRGLVRLGKISTTVWVNPQIAIT